MNHGYSWSANVNYNYDLRYFIHAGTLIEKQPDYFGFIVDRVPRSLYYSAGARWNIKNESFLKEVKQVDNLILFFDWAKLNPEKEKYVYGPFDAESFTYLSGGAFVRLFNRVNLTANYFSRKTDDLVTFDYLDYPIAEIGDNIFLISARKGFNPRSVSDYGIRFVRDYSRSRTRKGTASSVPLLRTFSLGLTMIL